MKFLKENMLLEDIEAVRKYYPTIPPAMFDRLIRLDPTFNPARESLGTYGKWILNLFKKGVEFDKNHITDALSLFDRYKSKLDIKDIGKYKDVQEIDDAVDALLQQGVEKTKSQEKKEKSRVSIEDNATKVYENAKWVVYTPHTYEASCKLGRGARWCTASSTGRGQFGAFTKEGPLYIIINKENPEEKYQLHFESNQFMTIENTRMRGGLDAFFVRKPSLFPIFKDKVDSSEEIQEAINFFRGNKERVFEYTGEAPSYLIRNNIKKVIAHTDIEPETFKRMLSLTEVVVKPSVKTIGEESFLYCSELKVLELHEGLETIEERAFESCDSLGTVVIPSTVQSIANTAFRYCGDLNIVNNSNTQVVVED